MTTDRGEVINVSGIVVKTAPENSGAVLAELRASGLCEVHFQDGTGKIIVTVEGRDIGEEMQKVKTIMKIHGVLSADLAYSYSEKEMHDAAELIMKIKDA